MGTGFTTFVFPLYVQEISPKAIVDLSASIIVASTGFGLIGGLEFATVMRHHWKKLYLWGLIPIAGAIGAILFMPESHMFYVAQDKDEEAIAIL